MSDALDRIVGPDLRALLRDLIREEVEALLTERDGPQRWMTPKDAAVRYGISAAALRKRCDRGTIPHSRMPGKGVLIDVHALDAELERRRR